MAAASVALPETPLLGVLPGTGGLTRVVDKRKVRRDLADDFSTLTEGVRGKRAVEWPLRRRGVSDQPVPGSASRSARRSWRRNRIARRAAPASRSARCRRRSTATSFTYKYVKGVDRSREARVRADDRRARLAAAGDGRRISSRPATVVGAARVPRVRRRAAAAAAERAGDRHRDRCAPTGDPEAVLAVDAVLRRQRVALAGARDHRP